MRIPGRCQAVLGLLAILLVGCAPVFRPVSPGQRMNLHGFSILPPQGSGWLMAESDSGPRRAMFGKAFGRGPLPTLVAVASAADMPPEITARDADELRQAMERLTWEQSRVLQGRYVLKQYSPTVDRSPGAECIRYDLLQEETNNPALRGRILEIRVSGLDCLHPANRRLMIKVYYSLRTERGSAFLLDPGTQQELEAFLRSLSFRALP